MSQDFCPPRFVLLLDCCLWLCCDSPPILHGDSLSWKGVKDRRVVGHSHFYQSVTSSLWGKSTQQHGNTHCTVTVQPCIKSEEEGTKLGKFFSSTLRKDWFVLPDFPPLLLHIVTAISSQPICYVLSVLSCFSKKQSFSASTTSAENPEAS